MGKAINGSVFQLMGAGPYAKAPAGNTASGFTSPVINVQQVDLISLQFVWTGAPTGTFDIQASNDYEDVNGTVLNAGTWDSVPFSPSIGAPSGSAGHATAAMALFPGRALRVVYAGSGTGTATINVTTKGI
jgi:hypothetical protein